MRHLPTISVAAITAIAIAILLLNSEIPKEIDIPEFSTVDTDLDGAINKDEASQVPKVANLYYGADLDQDGKLNASEYERAKKHLERKS